MGAALLFGSFAAFADVLLQLQRLSDTDALLVGSGSLGTSVPAENQHSLFLASRPVFNSAKPAGG